MATEALKTQTFVWQGTDRRGNTAKGEIQSENLGLAKAQLRKQGITPKSISRKGKALFGERKKAITPMDIAVFTRQMATMVKAGVPLVQSFDIVADGLENPTMRELLITIKNDVAGGTSFAAALSKHPRYFDDLYCNLVNSGEQSGRLETMLDRVATYKEKTENLKKKIKKAITYPAAVIVVAIVVTAVLLIWVVPVFAQTFQSFGSDLPVFTQFVMDLSEFFQEWWVIMLLGLVAAVYAFREAKLRSIRFAEFLDVTALKVPIVGTIVYNSIVARFSRTLSTTFAAGVPLVDALDSVAGAAGNSVYYKAIKQIKDDVTVGQPLNVAIRTTGRFPMMLLHMVTIGEESGSLDEMLDKVAEHYEMEVDTAVDNLTALLEPFIMAVLGILVGGLLVAMYLPIFMLGSVI
jgi:type IV pilus assembly protein PilC